MCEDEEGVEEDWIWRDRTQRKRMGRAARVERTMAREREPEGRRRGGREGGREGR